MMLTFYPTAAVFCPGGTTEISRGQDRSGRRPRDNALNTGVLKGRWNPMESRHSRAPLGRKKMLIVFPGVALTAYPRLISFALPEQANANLCAFVPPKTARNQIN
jgi:hypothetical protein